MEHKIFDKTTVRFIVVGIINTIVGTSVMFLCYNVLHFGYWISSAANYVIGSIVSYFLNKYYTFKSKKKSLKEIILFIINISICYFVAYGLAKPFVTYLLKNQSISIKENIAMLVGMVLFVGFNYIGQKFIVFKYNTRG